MIGYLRRLTIRNLVSPYGLALFSYIVFLFAWVFPPSVYSSYVQEPDLMYLSPLAFAFYTSCLLAFIAGVRASRYLRISRKAETAAMISTRNPVTYIAVPLLLATALCFVYLILLGAKIDIIGTFAAQQGEAAKAALSSGETTVGGKWNLSVQTLTVVLWWSAFRVGQLRVRSNSKRLILGLIFVGFCVDVLTCVAKVDRSSLLPLIIGLVVIYFYRKSIGKNVRLGSLIVKAAASIVGVVAVFSVLSFARGASAVNRLVLELMGYSLVSYNRMTALLNGSMHYLYAGKGIYISVYLSTDSVLNRALNLQRFFGSQTFKQVWESEFISVAGAGLNPGYIWSGAFGYLYSDLGWETLFYLFLVGIFGGFLWRGFNAGKTIAVVIYIWYAVSILFWLGTNVLFQGEIITTLECGILLWLYERAFARRVQSTTSAITQKASISHLGQVAV